MKKYIANENKSYFSLKWHIIANPCGGELEYLHRCLASSKRQQKGISVPGGYNWATLFLGGGGI
jgi:hypothetical protein